MNSNCRFLIVLLFFLSGCNNRKNAEQNYPATYAITRNEMKLTDLNGVAVNLEKYKGKTLFINFWATWCKPCLEEMPSIESAVKMLRNENIDFLFASEEEEPQINQFKKDNAFQFNYVRVENTAALAILALPTTFIFNTAGKLVFNESGSRQWDDKNNIGLIRDIIRSK